MWIIYALLAAIFAALTSIFAKIGIENVNANLATAIRTIVVILFAWGIVFATGVHSEIKNISMKSLVFLGISGLCTGFSWILFYKALKVQDASKVIPIDKLSVVISIILAFVVLKEKVTVQGIIGIVLITAGTLALVL